MLWFLILMILSVNTSDIYVTISPKSGWYTNSFNVTITPPEGYDTIRYSTCTQESTVQSPPTATSGTLYTDPILVSSHVVIQAVGINSITNKITNITTRSFFYYSEIPSQPQMASYITSNSAYLQNFTNALQSLPCLSFRSTTPYSSLSATEITTTVEFIPINSDESGWSATVYAYDTGEGSLTYAKKSIRFRFSIGDDTKLTNYFFKGFDWGMSMNGVDMNSVSLRSHSQDSVFGQPYSVRPLLMRNIWHDWTAEDLGHFAPKARAIHCFWNGEYVGLYHARSRIDDDLQTAYYGADKDSFNVVASGKVSDGTGATWTNIIVPKSTSWSQISSYIETNSLIDFMLIFHYTGNIDTGSTHNWQSNGPTLGSPFLGEDSGWKFFHSDEDFSFYYTSPSVSSLAYGTLSGIFSNLISEGNSDFIMAFKDRIHKLLLDSEGALTDANVISRFERIRNTFQYDLAIILESARWGIKWTGSQWTKDVWVSDLQNLYNNWITGRNAILKSQYLSTSPFSKYSLFTLSAPTFSLQNGKIVDPGTELSVTSTSTNCYILYTTNGEDPRNSGDGINPNAVITNSISVEIEIFTPTTVYARCKSDSTGWGPIDSVFVAVNESCVLCGNIVLTEIFYHTLDPPDVSQKLNNFIEIKNIGNSTQNLNGAYFEVFQFTFPPFLLEPGEFFVITRSYQDFKDVAGKDADGRYWGKISQNSDEIILYDPIGNVVFDISYKDTVPWSEIVDGFGYSLVQRNESEVTISSSSAKHWRTSTNLGGSPGEDDPEIPKNRTIQIFINEISSFLNETEPEWVEFYNPTNSTVSLYGWVLTDGYKDPKNSFRAKNDTPLSTYEIPANGYVTLDSELIGFRFSNDGGSFFSFGTQCCDFDGETPVINGEWIEQDYSEVLPKYSLGRFQLSNGEFVFTILANSTPGEENSKAYIPPVVITGIMSEQNSGNYSNMQFIRLTCVSTSNISLQGWEITIGSNSVKFKNIELSPNQNFYLINETTEILDFQKAYGIGYFDPTAVILQAFQKHTLSTTITLRQYVSGEKFTVNVDSVSVPDFFTEKKRSIQEMPNVLTRSLPAEFSGDPSSWETVAATTPKNPIDCVGTWENWENCLCSLKIQYRFYNITEVAAYYGKDCEIPNNSSQTQNCQCTELQPQFQPEFGDINGTDDASSTKGNFPLWLSILLIAVAAFFAGLVALIVVIAIWKLANKNEIV